MIATRYSVKCERCGGESAPIVCGQHTGQEHCEREVERILEWLERIESRLVEKINSAMPSDNVPDSIAIPKLNRLEARQSALESAFHVIRSEARKLTS